jgi:hypothetical protein
MEFLARHFNGISLAASILAALLGSSALVTGLTVWKDRRDRRRKLLRHWRITVGDACAICKSDTEALRFLHEQAEWEEMKPHLGKDALSAKTYELLKPLVLRDLQKLAKKWNVTD